MKDKKGLWYITQKSRKNIIFQLRKNFSKGKKLCTNQKDGEK